VTHFAQAEKQLPFIVSEPSQYNYRPETTLAMCRAYPLIAETYFEQGRMSIGCL
jgi:hypothetical protein